ncbi:MAG: uroporphyrinogen-III synthase [Pseudobacteriovorax sp.]|nr:uroporphyrinogen-III synthase [Pseudobacteriovorax sp.]
MNIIWTRSLDKWDEDIRLFKNTRPKHVPLIRLLDRNIDGQCLKCQDWYLITSSYAARRFANSWSHHAPAHVVTFSPTVAEILGDQQVEFTEALGVSDLIEKRGRHWKTMGAPFVFFGAMKPAFPVVETLNALGITASHVVAYETLPKEELSDPERHLLSHPAVVALASPSAVTSLHHLFQLYQIDVNHQFIVIGNTSAKSCIEYLSPPIVARNPTLKDLAIACEKAALLA